jgi:DNA-binding HxlR family transcriptional regulator
MQAPIPGVHTKETCGAAANAIRDTLYVLGGKWKLPILMTLASGPLRFRELQKTLEDITPKVLSKELRDLEMNEFVSRTVHPTTPVTVEYSLTGYSNTLQPVLLALRDWGVAHRKRLKESLKAAAQSESAANGAEKKTGENKVTENAVGI